MRMGWRGAFFFGLVLSTLTGAWAVAPASPLVHLQWSPDHPPAGDHAPAVVPFRGAHGLRFERASGTRLDLTTVANETDFGFAGALSVALVVRPAMLSGQSALVSKYRLATGGRCYELGLQSSGAVYWVVSPDGNFSGSARQLDTAFRVVAGSDYLLTATYQPGQRMSVYANGGLVQSVSDNVPDRIHQNSEIPMLGARSSGDAFADGILGDVWFYDRVLDATEVAGLAAEVGLTNAPPRDPVPFEEALYPPGYVYPPVRQLTSGPKFHWFGYYDVQEFDPTGQIGRAHV